MYIFVLNIGSSTVKYELFQHGNLKSAAKGMADHVTKNHAGVIQKILRGFVSRKIIRDFSEIRTVGHRVVHGGTKFWKPTVITPKVIAEIRKLSSLAPLHNPVNLAGILAAKKLLPRAKQVAVFDTAFHHTIPLKATTYALPRKLTKKFGIQRYGFHGISHEYVAQEAQKQLSVKKTQRIVICHLGNGCSITAVLNGKSVDTSMGFTPLEGVPMGTRAGDLDPGILLFLLEKGFSGKKLAEILNHESGFLGLSGISSDVRTLWEKAKSGKNGGAAGTAKAARFALEVFCHHVSKYIGGYAAVLGGLDCLVFTGGIGENAWYLRKAVISQLKFLEKFRVLVIPTHEEKHIAVQTKTV